MAVEQRGNTAYLAAGATLQVPLEERLAPLLQIPALQVVDHGHVVNVVPAFRLDLVPTRIVEAAQLGSGRRPPLIGLLSSAGRVGDSMMAPGRGAGLGGGVIVTIAALLG